MRHSWELFGPVYECYYYQKVACIAMYQWWGLLHGSEMFGSHNQLLLVGLKNTRVTWIESTQQRKSLQVYHQIAWAVMIIFACTYWWYAGLLYTRPVRHKGANDGAQESIMRFWRSRNGPHHSNTETTLQRWCLLASISSLLVFLYCL